MEHRGMWAQSTSGYALAQLSLVRYCYTWLVSAFSRVGLLVRLG